MPVFYSSEFKIDLPDDCLNASTYAFVLPAQGGFRPSVVVKVEHFTERVVLQEHAEKQLAILRETVVNLQVIEEVSDRHSSYDCMTYIFEWGAQESSRYRQMQRYIFVPRRSAIFSLTATDLASHYAQTAATLDRILLSFLPSDTLE